jgi:hypothetical protein
MACTVISVISVLWQGRFEKASNIHNAATSGPVTDVRERKSLYGICFSPALPTGWWLKQPQR